jgi:hypothetical protein
VVAFQFYLQSGKQKSWRGPSQVSRVGQEWQSCCFWSKYPWWRRKCETVHYCDARASCFVAEVWGEVFANFRAVPIKRHSTRQNWLFGLPRRILCECQSKWWAALGFALHFPLGGLLHCLRVITVNPVLITRKVVWLEVIWRSSSQTLTHCSFWSAVRNRIRPDSRRQIKGHKESADPPALAALNFVSWLPRYASTAIYHCSTLLQLLYRWQHQYRKLWKTIFTASLINMVEN